MLIQTFEREYKVISHVLTFDMGEIYICRDLSTDCEYTVLSIRNKSFVPELMSDLTARIQPGIFTDYIEHFVFEGDFYIVMKYFRGQTLREKLDSEYCSLNERLQIGAKILEKMLLLDMPDYFQRNCLTETQIIVKPSLDILFNYIPSDIRSFARVDDRAVLQALTAILEKLFADELAKQLAPPLNQFHFALRNEQYFDNMKIYTEYKQMWREVERISADDLQKPKSKLFLLWERMKRQLKALKRLTAAALLLLAFAYLIYSIGTVVDPQITEKKHYDFIGSVKILENQ